MAISEIQLPNKQEFYRHIQTIAGEVKNKMLRWGEVSEFINAMTGTDLTKMGITDPQAIAELVDFKNMLGELVGTFDGKAPILKKPHRGVINKLRVITTV